MIETTVCTAKISENTAGKIIELIEAVESLVFGLVTALECPLYADNDADSELPVTGGQYFAGNEKAILAIFGQTIHDNFSFLTEFIDNLQKFRDLK